MYAKKQKIVSAYVSKHKSNHKKQVNLLIISNGEKWYYLIVKKLLALLRGITSKHHGDIYYLNHFHSFATENKLQFHKRARENKDFCKIIIPSKDTKILEFNQY